MCRFKSGLILKDRCIICEDSEDSHTEMLKQLNIADNQINAMKTFVRAELFPLNNKWWTDPVTWTFHVDQDILPDWYLEDKEKYEQDFRKSVCDWIKIHVIVNKDIDTLKSGYYRVKNCKIKVLSSDTHVFLEDSEIEKMEDNACIDEMHGVSKVYEMYDSSAILNVYADSEVVHMRNQSSINHMYYNSGVFEMNDESHVDEMHGISEIEFMHGYSSVGKLCNNTQVNHMNWCSRIGSMSENSSVLLMSDKSEIKKMMGNSFVKEMRNSASICEMYDGAMARKSYCGIFTFFIPKNSSFQML